HHTPHTSHHTNPRLTPAPHPPPPHSTHHTPHTHTHTHTHTHIPVFPHLVLVLDLDEEWQGETDLGQLSDAHAVLGAVELWRVVILVNQGEGEGGHPRGV